MMNVKGNRNCSSVTGVEKKPNGIFRGGLTFTHSHQSFNNFYIVILAQ